MGYIYDFDHEHDASPEELRARLGGKGANLAVMSTGLGLPVPPGFTITTAACAAYLEDGWPDGLDEELRAHMARMEEKVGRPFGGPGAPLLVSVRSGAPVSMPGMMDTILNLGMTDEAEAGLVEISGSAEFAAACRERLASMYGDIVGVADVPADPWDQLRGAVEAVFLSWNSDRARTYRTREQIPDDLGTAVNVQTMVFGNWGPDSSTGVVFTRDPASGEPGLYGDILFQAQGEDLVSGSHTPEPITALDEAMPDVARELREYADLLERHYRDVCDIEFTVERGKLWMLQVRVGKRTPQAALRSAVDMAEDEGFPLTREEAVRRVAAHLADPPTMAVEAARDLPVAATGLPASPGIASGAVVTNPDAAVRISDEGRSVILVRSETSPDDVHGMARSAGILTARGGLTSHAAVVARGWGIPAVVGAEAIEVDDGFVVIAGRRVSEGDVISIDGTSGEIYVGAIQAEMVPTAEAAKLLEWADELDMDLGSGDERRQEMGGAESTRGDGPADDTIIRALLVKGFATSELLAAAVLCDEDSLTEPVERMTEAGLVGATGGMYQLTDEGRGRGKELLESDKAEWGIDAANAALDDFIPIDDRMKHVVTAWQMRDVDGDPVLNDHTDAEYDAAVLADFAAVHQDAAAWLSPLVAGLSRLDDYLQRLTHAADAVAAGDHAFIASPRIDSYHSVWFELHEDLILLAGRTREDEVAAGRA